MDRDTLTQPGAHEATPLIEIRNLRTAFGSFVVHDKLDLTVNQGDIMALVGGSGSGKTTLLRQILGLERPAAGSVKVFGENIHELGAGNEENADANANTNTDTKANVHRKLHHKAGHNARTVERQQALRNRWGMLFQQGALFSALTAFDNVAQPMRELRTLPEELVRDAALLKLHMVGIDPAQAMKMPAGLSGGMIKRVALARALALEPELLFLDEPTAGLDPHLSETFVELIRSLHREMRLTVVMVTHDLDTLFALSSRIAVLADKHVIIDGTPTEVVAYRHPFIEEFFGGERGRRALEGYHEESRQ